MPYRSHNGVPSAGASLDLLLHRISANLMPTITTGLFFVSRQRASATDSPDGFVLTLRIVDNQGPGKVEPYVVTWAGAAARNWWREHEHHLQPGQPLALELVNPRSFPGMRAPETHAVVTRCELAPVAPSWIRRNSPAAH